MKFAYFLPAQPYTLATCVYSVDEMIPIWCIKGALTFNTVTQIHTYSQTCIRMFIHVYCTESAKNNAYKMLYSGSKKLENTRIHSHLRPSS